MACHHGLHHCQQRRASSSVTLVLCGAISLLFLCVAPALLHDSITAEESELTNYVWPSCDFTTIGTDIESWRSKRWCRRAKILIGLPSPAHLVAKIVPTLTVTISMLLYRNTRKLNLLGAHNPHTCLHYGYTCVQFHLVKTCYMSCSDAMCGINIPVIHGIHRLCMYITIGCFTLDIWAYLTCFELVESCYIVYVVTFVSFYSVQCSDSYLQDFLGHRDAPAFLVDYKEVLFEWGKRCSRNST